MIKLKSIYIYGFKDKNREIRLTFSEEPITVIYGENGCGKTTFLRVLNAILSKNDDILIAENIQEIILEYILNNEIKHLNILVENRVVSWGNNITDLADNSSSIAFGIYRGMTENKDYLEQINMMTQLVSMVSKFPSSQPNKEIVASFGNILMPFINKEQSKLKRFTQEQITKNRHNFSDFIRIEEVYTSILELYKYGQELFSQKFGTAFSETLENAEKILSSKDEQSFMLPTGFYEQFIQYKDFLKLTLSTVSEVTTFNKKIVDYLDNGNLEVTSNSKIFTALLRRILQKIQEPNPYLEAIRKLVEIFNSYLYGGKKLVINSENAYIYLGLDENGQEKTHSINDLSSGERNFLTMLALFLVFEQQRDFIIIDEPEISLNMKWQRKILPLFNELSPNSQIIVATHSPSIAHKKSNYLVELI